jgi:thymidylate synthase (FAD)
MKLTVVAATAVMEIPESVEGTAIADAMFNTEEDVDILHEFAGRACYKSWNRPNPDTATNEGYLAHIIESQHESVLEHGSVSFYVEGVSRSLLLELERHRHLSFSVESQRYVSTSKHHRDEVVIPPLFREAGDAGSIAEANLKGHYEASLRLYDQTYMDLREAGFGVKQAREAARAFLPNATPVDFVVTGNLRAWRYVIAKRDADGADAEIREFAQAVAEALREYAPNSMQ